MNGVNEAFYFVIDMLVKMQAIFIGAARTIGRPVFVIAFGLAVFNYALNGTGLKDSLIKLGKALFFFFLVIGLYPRVIGFITSYTFDLGKAAAFSGTVESSYNKTKGDIAEYAEDAKATNKKSTAAANLTNQAGEGGRPDLYFGELLVTRRTNNLQYTTVAPAALLQATLLVAAECFRAANDATAEAKATKPNTWGIGNMIKALLCAFFIIITGAFGVLEYTVAFLEFMFISSVGIILLPFCLWDGSKFITEKFVGALLGFFVKLLLCNICVFLMLAGYMSLAGHFTKNPFTALPDEILMVVFCCLFFFFICRQAPALAQSLLTGAPSLNAAGAISSAVTAGAAAAGAAGLAAKGGFGLTSAIAKAGGAGSTAFKNAGGGIAGVVAGIGTGLGSMAGSAGTAIGNKAGDLTRSLLGVKSNGYNNNDARQRFGQTNKDGTRQTFGQHFANMAKMGANPGNDPLAKTNPASTTSTASSTRGDGGTSAAQPSNDAQPAAPTVTMNVT